MKVKTAQEVIASIARAVKTLPESDKRILEDIKTMRFKIRPLEGDINRLNAFDPNLLSSLWRIGKIDQIVRASFDNLSEREQDVLMEYLQLLDEETQSVSLRSSGFSDRLDILKLEVFRDEIGEDTEIIN